MSIQSKPYNPPNIVNRLVEFTTGKQRAKNKQKKTKNTLAVGGSLFTGILNRMSLRMRFAMSASPPLNSIFSGMAHFGSVGDTGVRRPLDWKY